MSERQTNKRHTGPTPIRVVVIHADTREVKHDRAGDHNDPDFRDWLGRTSYWALRNDYEVRTIPLPLD